MPVRLEQLVSATRERLERRKRERPLAELEREVAERGEGRPFMEALAHPGTSLVAEYKRRSPSAGTIRDNASVTEIVEAYERGGGAPPFVLPGGGHLRGSPHAPPGGRGGRRPPLLRQGLPGGP